MRAKEISSVTWFLVYEGQKKKNKKKRRLRPTDKTKKVGETSYAHECLVATTSSRFRSPRKRSTGENTATIESTHLNRHMPTIRRQTHGHNKQKKNEKITWRWLPPPAAAVAGRAVLEPARPESEIDANADVQRPPPPAPGAVATGRGGPVEEAEEEGDEEDEDSDATLERLDMGNPARENRLAAAASGTGTGSPSSSSCCCCCSRRDAPPSPPISVDEARRPLYAAGRWRWPT